MTGDSPEAANFNRLFLKHNRFICNYPPVLPEQRLGAMIGENRQLVTNEPVEFEK